MTRSRASAEAAQPLKPPDPASEEHSRVRVRVEGIVQGVGFRPFVYRLADEENLAGWVLNDARGVLLEAEGTAAALDRFKARLLTEAPPLAVIDTINTQAMPTDPPRDGTPDKTSGPAVFEIRPSTRGDDGERSGGGRSDVIVAPDTATCADCLAELFDRTDRRYRYPFVNCTNCGPRLTIVEGVPYDRAKTTMAGFPMCRECEAECRDPADRRFHAQPNACPACGPAARLLTGDGSEPSFGAVADASAIDQRDTVSVAAALLAAGKILAVKGLGGYHLACDARNDQAVQELRSRKHREHKPFALMVADVDTARSVIKLSDASAELLTSPAHPIVLAPETAADRVLTRQLSASVAPRLRELGVMHAYTPLHHLLLGDLALLLGEPSVLVMTSANVSDEPIAYDDSDALERLGGIADAFLVHDRPIRSRVDDSVVRAWPTELDGYDAIAKHPMQMVRRSRGYAPSPLFLPAPSERPLLATGADLKNTFALAHGKRAWLSHHIGDLEHYAALRSYQDGIEHFERLFEVRPELIVHDLHPGYASTRYALERSDQEGLPTLAVQHHHAHLAACLAEHGFGPDERVIGAIYDGTGYGTDGSVWGGEILVGGLAGFERAASLLPVPMPGSTAAVREPWRMACAWLAAADTAIPDTIAAVNRLSAARNVDAIMKVAQDRALSPLTSSMGRLFDAVAALCGIDDSVTYEGQAAIELEAMLAGATPREYEIAIVETGASSPRWLLDPRPLIRQVAADLGCVPIAAIAAGFHAAIADATARACVLAANDQGLDRVVLSGGVFLNQALLRNTTRLLSQAGLRVLTPCLLSPGDGAIAYGQAAIAAAAPSSR